MNYKVSERIKKCEPTVLPSIAAAPLITPLTP